MLADNRCKNDKFHYVAIKCEILNTRYARIHVVYFTFGVVDGGPKSNGLAGVDRGSKVLAFERLFLTRVTVCGTLFVCSLVH